MFTNTIKIIGQAPSKLNHPVISDIIKQLRQVTSVDLNQPNSQAPILDPLISFIQHLDNGGNQLAMATRVGEDWDSITYRELVIKIKKTAQFFIQNNLTQGKTIGVISESRYEYPMVIIAAFLAGNKVVPMDAKLSHHEWLNIVDHSELDAICLESPFNQAGLKLKESAAKDIQIFQMDQDQTQLKIPRIVLPDYVMDMEQFPSISPIDTAIINYTSGTTGMPKGVMLSLKNLFFQAISLKETVNLNQKRMLSVLPMNHMFEMTAGIFYPLFSYAEIYFARTLLPLQIVDILKSKKITNMNCVPLVLDAFKAGIERKLKKLPKAKQKIFQTLLKSAKFMPQNIKKTVFKEIHEQFGGHFEFFVSGGAPLNDETFKFFESLGFPVIQGFGLTETSPIVSMNSLEERKLGSIGKALDKVKIKIKKNKPEDKTGTILIKGPNIMLGYFKNPELTKEVIDKNGWFNSGDIGYIDNDGYLYITGREKNLIVTHGGKKVHPEEVETVLAQSPLVQEVAVMGFKDKETQKERVGCILVLTEEYQQMDLKTVEKQLSSLKNQLAAYKWPFQFYIQNEEFIKTTTKKIARNKIINPF